MEQKYIIIALVVLTAALAGIGAVTNSAPIITMSASSLTGLFAYLQVRKD